jgi:hypothetical protein
VFSVSQVQHFAPQLRGPDLRGPFQPFAHCLHVAAEILEQNTGTTQKAHRPLWVADGSHGAPDQQTVESGKNSLQLIGEFCDKLFHGVSLPYRCGSSRTHNDTQIGKRLGISITNHKSEIANRQSTIGNHRQF